MLRRISDALFMIDNDRYLKLTLIERYPCKALILNLGKMDSTFFARFVRILFPQLTRNRCWSSIPVAEVYITVLTP
jgi:hypothetical protein